MICSDYISIIKEIKNLKTIWLKNAYQMKVIGNFFNKICLKKIVYTVEKNKLILSSEHLGKYSLEIKKCMQRTINKQISFCKFNVVFSPKKIPESLVLYPFKCSDCNIAYIGETSCYYQLCHSEHLGISKVAKLPSKNSKKNYHGCAKPY